MPEFKSIAGKYYLNLIALIGIILISLLTIGFGEGAKLYLDEKMNSPFVSFVTVTIPSALVNDIKIDDKDDVMAERYKVKEDSLSFYDYFGVKKPYFTYHEIRKFFNPENQKTVSTNIIMGTVDDPILKYIENQDKQSEGLSFNPNNNRFDPEGWGCIVTQDFLLSKNKLGYSDINVSYVIYKRNIDEQYREIAIPIQGIVSSLPDNRDMIVGEKLYKSFDDQDFYRELVLKDSTNGYLQYYTNDEKIITYFENIQDSDIRVEKKTTEDVLYYGGVIYSINITDTSKKQQLENNIPEGEKIKIYIFDRVGLGEPTILDDVKERIVFQFVDEEKLGLVDELNRFLKENFTKEKKSLEIDMSIIKSKQNFDLFNRLAKLLSVALIFFSIISIVIFIINLIVSHISKNRRNLGTLKAFGLSNNYIIIIYSSISSSLITIAFVISYIISLLIGNLLVSNAGIYMGISDVTELRFENYPIEQLLLYFIILPSILIYGKVWWELRGNTPGDLIYERD